MLLQTLNLLEGMDLRRLGHNSPAYIHAVVEAIKLAAADREAYYGDPRFIEVPIDELLSRSYAERRRGLIRADRAWPDMPPAGEVAGARRPSQAGEAVHAPAGPALPEQQDAHDTSYLCVVDKDGNAFSATPSDGSRHAPVVPGTGLVPSTRGAQSWTDPDHPSCVAPGKRPRLTPNPALALSEGKLIMPFGSPGGDVQTQAMAQAFLNIFVFGMDPQSAVEAPRFASYSFPSSFEPHEVRPGRLCVEGSIDAGAGETLAALGHRIKWWPKRTWRAGSVCAILAEPGNGVMHGAADPRRQACAVGW